jgi:SAM-dependent methyltransferase
MVKNSARTLTPDEAKTFYDEFGSKQDEQAFYEEPALEALRCNAALHEATSLFEFGCGTGRFAADLLQNHLPERARYSGIDLSSTMVELAATRLARFGARATVALASAEARLPLEQGSIDRFVSTYVLDLLSTTVQVQVLEQARVALSPGGLLCAAGITPGTTLRSRLVMGVWQRIFALNPRWVGGCRPVRMIDQLAPEAWEIRFHTVVVAWGIASEVLIAAPRET